MNGGRGSGSAAPVAAIVARAEDFVAVAALALMASLPVLELLLRTLFGAGLPGTVGYVQHLTLWVGFLGAVVAARKRRHLSLAAAFVALPEMLHRWGGRLAAVASTAVACGLAVASYDFVTFEMDSPVLIGGWLPTWIPAAVLPVAFIALAVHFVVGQRSWIDRLIALAGVPIAASIGLLAEPIAGSIAWPLIGVVVVLAFLGAPIFVALGAAALLLFFADGVPVAAIPVETFRIVVSPSIPTIPLFALAGYLLAEGGASRRLVRCFRALFAWMPGGLAVVTTLVFAFFSTFTGASGVTIVALAGLMLPVLVKNGYRERFSLGLVTGTGSLGLLFPPSLAVILYGVVAHVPIRDLFLAGIVPGLVMVAAVSLFGIGQGLRMGAARPTFDRREALAALGEAKWDLALPVIALVGIFGGLTTLVEAAAVTAVYALLLETVIHRELSLFRDVPRVLIKCVTLIGGVFVILGVALGLTNYLVDAQVPAQAAAWVRDTVESRLLFLLALNVFLLVVGCLMDIYSAIFVVVPLILPISQVYGIHPLHLGIIFLVNLELGYLTPPVGMNLFLSSLRFDKPLGEIARSVLPFLAILLAVLLVITYVPEVSLALVDLQ
jgi:tripartite ATP-independent transporter DctM subunit